MEPVLFTARLKLTLVTTAHRGSVELEWLHRLRSDERTTWWSIHRRSESLEDTERVIRSFLPITTTTTAASAAAAAGVDNDEKTYRVAYAVHALRDPSARATDTHSGRGRDRDATPDSEFIGLVTLTSLSANALALPEHLTFPSADTATATLPVEVAYMFLPAAWGKGYATEAVTRVYDACKRALGSRGGRGGVGEEAEGFWAPYKRVYVRAIVNEENAASLRVVDKAGMAMRGVYEWSGQPVWLAGRWQQGSRLCIFGMLLDVPGAAAAAAEEEEEEEEGSG